MLVEEKYCKTKLLFTATHTSIQKGVCNKCSQNPSFAKFCTKEKRDWQTGLVRSKDCLSGSKSNIGKILFNPFLIPEYQTSFPSIQLGALGANRALQTVQSGQMLNLVIIGAQAMCPKTAPGHSQVTCGHFGADQPADHSFVTLFCICLEFVS